MSEQDKYYMKESVENTIGQELSDGEFEMLLKDWNAFTKNPMAYGTVVVNCVEQYLEDIRKLCNA